jgi:hypothetical protein
LKTKQKSWRLEKKLKPANNRLTKKRIINGEKIILQTFRRKSMLAPQHIYFQKNLYSSHLKSKLGVKRGRARSQRGLNW